MSIRPLPPMRRRHTRPRWLRRLERRLRERAAYLPTIEPPAGAEERCVELALREGVLSADASTPRV